MIEIFKELVSHFFVGSELKGLYDGGDYYILSIAPISMSKDDVMLDGLYKVDKETFKIEGYSPAMDLEVFKKAIKNPLFVKE